MPEADAQRIVIFLDKLVLKTSGGKPVFCKYVYCPGKNDLSVNPPVPRHPIFQPNHPLPGISAARNVGTVRFIAIQGDIQLNLLYPRLSACRYKLKISEINHAVSAEDQPEKRT